MGDRPVGAASMQSAALAMLAVPVLLNLGVRPAARMVSRANWGRDHGIDPRFEFRSRGVRRG